MTLAILISRILHVLLGVFWAGTIFFLVLFLQPSVQSVGPDGGRVMQALQKRHFLNVMPAVAALTILSGGFLYWRLIQGFGAGWIATPFGVALTVGGVASLVAFGQGLFLMRPATLRVGVLSASLAGTSEEGKREEVRAEIAILKARSRAHARWVSLWLGVAVIAMAVARYL